MGVCKRGAKIKKYIFGRRYAKNKFLYICPRIFLLKIKKTMKKALTLLTAFVFAGLVACGPSAAEKKVLEEQLQKAADSTANALLQQASTSASDTAKTKAVAPADTTKK